MRRKQSIKNGIASIIQNCIAILIGLIAQAIFIKILNVEYLGLNGLFNNVVSILGIVELGIGNAIVYKLYKPIADNDIETIKNIPKKMKKEVSDVNTSNRIYFNKYDPIIYTKLVDDHIELTVRYLMHPKKARHTESVIWNKIYLAYKDKKIDLYIEK